MLKVAKIPVDIQQVIDYNQGSLAGERQRSVKLHTQKGQNNRLCTLQHSEGADQNSSSGFNAVSTVDHLDPGTSL